MRFISTSRLVGTVAAILALATPALTQTASASDHDKGGDESADPRSFGIVEGEDWSQGPELAAGRVLEADPQFGGAWFDEAGVFHVLLKAGYSETLLKEARAKLDDPSDMVVGKAEYTWSELEAEHRKFESLVPALKEAGIEVGMAGPKASENRVRAQIFGDLDAARNLVQIRRISTPALVLEEAPAGAPKGLKTFLGRDNDQVPFYAGNYIWNSTTNGRCSSGPGVKRDGVEYALTAAHCYNINRAVKIKSPSATPTGNETTVGPVTHRSVADGGIDSELIEASVDNWMWMTPTTSTPAAVPTQLTPGSNYQGRVVCGNGAWTGPRCSATIQDVGFCVNLADQGGDSFARRACDLAVAFRPPGVVAGPGDSGGPVYGTGNGDREYVGTVTGGDPYNGTTLPCDRWASERPGSVCSRFVTYTMMYQITQRFEGLTLAN